MKKLLLVSSSNLHGTGYLDHCAEAAQAMFAGAAPILFIPYALKDLDAYAAKAVARFGEMGLELRSIHKSSDPRQAVAEAGGFFTGGGNTFRLLKRLYELDVVTAIRQRVEEGAPYMGTSAGSNIACKSIRTTNDMPIVYPPSFDALQLVPFSLNPHYLLPDPNSTHQGETRDTRIAEFHEENDEPVVGLMEGGMLRLDGEGLWLIGVRGGRLFRRGEPSQDLEPGANLDTLLS